MEVEQTSAFENANKYPITKLDVIYGFHKFFTDPPKINLTKLP